MIRQIITGSVAGYLLGSALRAADWHFKQKPTPKINSFVSQDDTITLVGRPDPLDNLFTSAISACFKPMLPKGCDSITDLSTCISEKTNSSTKIMACLGLILIPLEPYINNRYCTPYFIATYFTKEFAMALASTYLATGYFRGNTELGFCINPIGVPCKKIKEFFFKPNTPNDDKEERRKKTLIAYNIRTHHDDDENTIHNSI